MPQKEKKKKDSGPARHEFAIGEQMDPSFDTLSKISERKERKRSRSRASEGNDDGDDGKAGDSHFEQNMGNKILKEAKLQRLELEREAEENAGVSRRGDAPYSVKNAISSAAKKYNESDSEDEEVGDGFVEDYDYEVMKTTTTICEMR